MVRGGMVPTFAISVIGMLVFSALRWDRDEEAIVVPGKACLSKTMIPATYIYARGTKSCR